MISLLDLVLCVAVLGSSECETAAMVRAALPETALAAAAFSAARERTDDPLIYRLLVLVEHHFYFSV